MVNKTDGEKGLKEPILSAHLHDDEIFKKFLTNNFFNVNVLYNKRNKIGSYYQNI